MYTATKERLANRFVIKVNDSNEEEMKGKFRKIWTTMRTSPEQEEINRVMGELKENQYISIFISEGKDYIDRETGNISDDARLNIQNFRSMIANAVRYNQYPRISGSKRFAYQTNVSLELDGNYWLLVRRLSPMGNNPNNNNNQKPRYSNR